MMRVADIMNTIVQNGEVAKESIDKFMVIFNADIDGFLKEIE